MSIDPIPEGYRSVTPYLIVSDAQKALDFVMAGLGGRIKELSKTPDGSIMHAALWVGDSIVMLGQAREPGSETSTMLYVYVPNVDEVFAQAIAAGGEISMPLADQFYGDRCGSVKDACGNTWCIATHIEDPSDEEIARRAQEAYGADAQGG